MIYHHLAHALRIIRTEPDLHKWGPLIDQLTPEQQAEVRPWLREQARMFGKRNSPPSPMPASAPFLKAQKRR